MLAAIALAGCGEHAGVGAAKVDAVDPFADRPDFFPLGVFFQSPHLAQQWASVGINMIAPANGTLTRDTLAKLRKLDMVAGGSINDDVSLADSGNTLAFFVARDEPDNAQPTGEGGLGPCLTPQELAEETAKLKAMGGGRPVLRNFGRGMVDPAWEGRGECAGKSDSYYPAAIASADIVSFDHYPVANGTGLEQVAVGARKLRSYIARGVGHQVQWGVIEVSAIKGGRAPTPAEVRSMAWMQIINGATGLIFFPWQVGEKGERIREDAVFADPAAVEGLAALTAEISALSPVIKGGARIAAKVDSSRPHSAMARKFGERTYVFVVNESPAPAEIAVSLEGLAGGVADVVGTDVTLAISGSTLTDRLGPYEPKIYRIAGTRT
jgi:hypothetical protein